MIAQEIVRAAPASDISEEVTRFPGAPVSLVGAGGRR
jgi:hypothetical protein